MHLVEFIVQLINEAKHDHESDIDMTKKIEIFVNEMKHKHTIRLTSLIIKSKVKQNLVRHFLKIMIEVYSRNLQKAMNDSGIEPSWNKIRSIMDTSYSETRKIAKESGVPEIFIDKFDDEYKKVYEFSRQRLETICTSELFIADSAKLTAVMAAISWSFDAVILVCEMTVSNLNGELEKSLNDSIFSVDCSNFF